MGTSPRLVLGGHIDDDKYVPVSTGPASANAIDIAMV